MPSLERIRFLIVDDNAYMIHIVETILRGFGAVKLFDARDATEAFHRLRHDSIDIVICDYMMEVLDGIEFTKLVRTSSDSGNRLVPILMLTAHTERSRIVQARDAGVNEVCAKPVTARELFSKVAAIIDRPRPFIKTATYFGPDRRRHKDANYTGPERRAQTPEAAPPEPAQDSPQDAAPTQSSNESNTSSAA